MLGLLGLQIFEATAADIADLRYLTQPRDRQQRRLPQEQARGRLQLRRHLPARPLYGQVDQRDRRHRVVLGDRKRMRNVPESGWRTR